MSTPPSDSSSAKPSSPALVLFAWLYVGIPLAWGVTQTFYKALALFH